MAQKVIPLHMIPDAASEVLEVGGERFLQSNESMFTFYKRTKGEHSEYFLALKEEKKILGARCPKCGLIRVPPFELYCPDCDFVKLEIVEMPDTGVMNTTPPITYFGHSLFQHQVPFGRGRVMLLGADTALPILVYTTKGVLTPRVFKKGTPVKVVFRDERFGKPTDIFAVPQSELTEKQIATKGLSESDLDFSSPIEPAVPAPTDESRRIFAEALQELKDLASRIPDSARAKKNLADWNCTIQVKTGGGSFAFMISPGALEVKEGSVDKADFVMISRDSNLFLDWLSFKEALTNAIISERLWISSNSEFTSVFKLDRLPRSVKRDI
jgi:uncharacterized OB-fold protein